VEEALIMIERHVTFNVIPGKEKDFEDLFKEKYSIAMSKQDGDPIPIS
jgi:hypothetical protein